MTLTTEVLSWGQERVRAGPWRGDNHVAYMAPLPSDPPPSTDFLRRCLDKLYCLGYDEVVTPALAGPEQAPFIAVGFAPYEQLRFLVHDLAHLSPRPLAPPARLRRAERDDWPAVLDVDSGSFTHFWRLDQAGLGEALSATPTVRFRVAVARPAPPVPGGWVAGYAIFGRAGDQGYLQRLAVAATARRLGIGRLLTLDGLRWLRRRGARRAVVNTQLGNDAAYNLYLHMGFRVEPSNLAVLSRRLVP